MGWIDDNLTPAQKAAGLTLKGGILRDKNGTILAADHPLTPAEITPQQVAAQAQIHTDLVNAAATMTDAQKYAAGLLPPVARFVSPTNGQYLRGVFPLKITTSAKGPIESIIVMLDGRVYQTLPVADVTKATLATASIPNGTHTLAVCATDTQGRQGQYDTIRVTVDNAVSATHPAPPAKPINSLPIAAANTYHDPYPIASQPAPVPVKPAVQPSTPVAAATAAVPIPNTRPVDLPVVDPPHDAHVSPYVDPLAVTTKPPEVLPPANGFFLPSIGAALSGATDAPKSATTGAAASPVDVTETLITVAVLLVVAALIFRYGAE